MEKTIIITGITAALIDKAEHASFYGVQGDTIEGSKARRACYNAAAEYLNDENIDWFGIDILKARSINTEGTKTPYKAEITFRYTTPA